MIAAWTTPLRQDIVPNAPRRAIGARPSGPRVAYQGEPGAYGDAAITRHWNGTGVSVGAPTFTSALTLVLTRRVDAALLPVWNSTIGPIGAVQELLYEKASQIELGDEVVIPVQHALLALPGASIDTLCAVGSHTVALAQCTRFLAEHPRITAYEAFDTAGAAAELAALVGAAPRGVRPPWYAGVPDAAPETLGVIASEAAAERHGLVVLATGVQDLTDNHTRFVVVRRRGGGRW